MGKRDEFYLFLLDIKKVFYFFKSISYETMKKNVFLISFLLIVDEEHENNLL